MTEELTERAPIKPFVFNDQVTGQKVSLDVSPLYTTLKIDGRSYYFIRETGRLDGTGTAVEEYGGPIVKE